MAVRSSAAISALNDTIEWLKVEGEVAIFDATNTTLERRKMVYDIVVIKNGFKCIYLESICDDQHLIETNIINMKIRSPDYKNNNMDNEEQWKTSAIVLSITPMFMYLLKKRRRVIPHS